MKKYLTLFLFIFTLLACNQYLPPTTSPYSGLTYINNYNGLTDAQRSDFYQYNYGIEWLPFNLLKNLKRPVSAGLSQELFLEHPERFGIYQNPINPSSPPIGITVGTNGMSGINCSICHTAVIANGDKFFIVDGANSTFSIGRYIQEMLTSMVFTLLEPGQFEDLYERMYGTNRKEGFAAVPLGVYQPLQTDLQAYQDGKDVDIVSSIKSFTSHPAAIASTNDSRFGLYVYMLKRVAFFIEQAGYAKSTIGSADAGLGQSNPWSSGKIQLAHKLLGKTTYPKQLGGNVNTPSLWGYRDSEWIFLEGQTNTMLERNTIQGIALLSDFDWETYATTLSIKKMQTIETYTKSIKPPVWDESVLGTIDQAAVARGKVTFNSRCKGCHQEDDGTRRSYQYMDVGTDPLYHAGQIDFYGKDFFKGTLAPFLKDVKKKMAAAEGITDVTKYEDGREPTEWRTPVGNVFEARPLKGCWATGPFLHNGSVRTIRDLLRPASEREDTFNVGTLQYDTADLGSKNEKVWWGSVQVSNCKNCLGASHQGHEIATDLLKSEQDDLIEFLKSY